MHCILLTPTTSATMIPYSLRRGVKLHVSVEIAKLKPDMTKIEVIGAFFPSLQSIFSVS